MKPNNPVETPLISPDVATLIPYQMARRLSVAAVSATQTEVTVLMQRADDATTIAEVQSATGRTVVPIEAPKEEIESLLDHLSGTLNTDDLWLQQRHIAALGRLVDHGVNIGQGESVRSLVDRALEFAPYSAEVWLMKARVAVHRQDVVDALTVACQIAPNDRRILRWIQSLQDLDDDHGEVSTPAEAPSTEDPAVEPAASAEPTVPDVAEEPSPPEPIPLDAARLARAETASPPRDQTSDDVPEANSPDAVRSIADRAFQDARMLSAIRDLDVLMTKTAESLQAIVRADSVSVYFRNRRRWMGYSTSESLQSRLNRALPKENRLADQAIRKGLPIVITDTASRLADVGSLVHDTGIRSFALLPIRVNGGIGGLAYLNFDVVERANEVFDADLGRAIELVLNCAGNVAGAVWEQREPHADAAIDGLTDAYTLEQFERMLAAEIERARRYRFSVSILAFDVDDFSRFNETDGRAFGDEVLRRIAGTVRSVERASDVLARRADDEFVALLPQTTARGAEIVARRMQTALSEDVLIQDRAVSVRASIGIATFPDEAADAASLLNAAELALYAAKAKASGAREAQKAGKNS